MPHLHVHSHYSMLEGVPSPRDLIGRAVACGMTSLALTDTGGLYGAIPFYQAAKAAGIRPILGVQLDNAVLLARTCIGYAALCQIITRYQIEPTFSLAEAAADTAAHLFILSNDQGLLLTLQEKGAAPLAAVTTYDDATSRYHAERLQAFAKKHGLPAVAVNPVYFLDPDDWAIHEVLTAIRLNTTLGALSPSDTADRRDFFRTPKERETLYGDWPELLETAEWVASECDVSFTLGVPHFPPCDIPANETPYSLLWNKAQAGLQERCPPVTPKATRRLQEELETIYELGFAPYFLIVHDIVQHARSKSIPIVGRGSAANSLVAYTLGITRVNPLDYNLYFERFLNHARRDCPDIDLDICWRRRDEVIDYVYQRYGNKQVAMICTFNRFKARAAVREVAKVFGYTNDEIGDITRRLPHYGTSDIRRIAEKLPECRGLKLNEEPLKSILDIATAIDAFPRHLSIHAGGLVIAPDELTHFTPLQRAPKGILITQYDMGPIEALGLVKIDLLGHRSLTVIDDTVKAVAKNRSIAVNVERVLHGDPLTARYLREGKTIGCFQIESPAMRSLLKQLAAEDVDMTIKALSLVRPGPSGSGMKQHFIDRHAGREETTYPHPALEDVLGDTYGVMLYQEDILKVAHTIAGMSLAEADGLRRAMGKKRSPKAMAALMRDFVEGATQHGLSLATAEDLWERIANFAKYSYCKAHACTYGELAWQCAYLKAHYPAEFMAAVLSNGGGFYDSSVYLEESRRLGVTLLAPHINHSAYAYRAEGEAIRVGLMAIRHLNHDTIQSLLQTRQEAPFTGLADLWARTDISEIDAESLIEAGACDAPTNTRPMLLWQLKTLAHRTRRTPTPRHATLFSYTQETRTLPALCNHSHHRRLQSEWNSFGTPLSTHPLHFYLSHLMQRPLVLATDMGSYGAQEITLVGWLIAERRVALEQGGCMKFLTLEDPSSVFEAILFPQAYQRYGHLLDSRGPFFLTGKIDASTPALSLILTHLERIDRQPKAPLQSDITPPLHWFKAF